MNENKGMTRRQFLKGALAGAVGLAAVSFFGPSVLVPAKGEGEAAGVAAVAVNPFDFARRTVLLNNGIEMPVLGLGTFGLSNEQAENSAYWALKAGHRLIDTASAYNNEAAVGRGIKRAIEEGIVTREEIFVTTKLWPMGGYNAGGIDAALEKLGLEYIDLLLLHQPMGDYIGGYKAMEEAVAAGKLRAIGISNFSAAQIEEIMAVQKLPLAFKPVLKKRKFFFHNGAVFFQVFQFLKERVPVHGRRIVSEASVPGGKGDFEIPVDDAAGIELICHSCRGAG